MTNMISTKLLHIKIQPRLKTITEVIAMCKLVQSVKWSQETSLSQLRITHIKAVLPCPPLCSRKTHPFSHLSCLFIKRQVWKYVLSSATTLNHQSHKPSLLSVDIFTVWASGVFYSFCSLRFGEVTDWVAVEACKGFVPHCFGYFSSEAYISKEFFIMPLLIWRDSITNHTNM